MLIGTKLRVELRFDGSVIAVTNVTVGPEVDTSLAETFKEAVGVNGNDYRFKQVFQDGDTWVVELQK